MSCPWHTCCSHCVNRPDAGPNPWRATGLEWQTESPPPVHNFEETPVVTIGPYAYSPEESENAHGDIDDRSR